MPFVSRKRGALCRAEREGKVGYSRRVEGPLVHLGQRLQYILWGRVGRPHRWLEGRASCTQAHAVYA